MLRYNKSEQDMPVTPVNHQFAIRNGGIVLCLILLLGGCSTNKVSPATLALQAELEARELKLQEQQKALQGKREKLKELAADVKSQQKKNMRATKRLRAEERSLEKREAQLKQAKQADASKKTTESNKTAEKPPADILLVGATEKLFVHPPNIELTGRMDTGAKRCMLGVFDLAEFERDGEPHVRFFIIPEEGAEKIEVTRPIKDSARFNELNSNGKKRPVVRLRVVLGSIDEQEEFVLVEDNKADVSAVSIGRNLLRDLAVVDVSKNMLIKPEAE